MTDCTWPDEEYDDSGYDDSSYCLCEDAIIDAIEGHGYCPSCQRSWTLTDDEIKAELRHQAEYAEAVEREMQAHGEQVRGEKA